jgi:hypothetical protein
MIDAGGLYSRVVNDDSIVIPSSVAKLTGARR